MSESKTLGSAHCGFTTSNVVSVIHCDTQFAESLLDILLKHRVYLCQVTGVTLHSHRGNSAKSQAPQESPSSDRPRLPT